MPKCTYRARPTDEERCHTLAEAGKSMCPRHSFLADLKASQAEGKHEAKVSRANRLPRTRLGLLEAGYHFTGTATCRGCNQRIEWWRTKLNKALPFNAMVHDDSLAVTHFATCSRANQFRKAG